MIVQDKITTCQWYEMYVLAKAYFKEHGNLNIPARYVDQKTGARLGAWIVNQRYARRDKTAVQKITQDQIAMLDEIGMNWSYEHGIEDAWEERILRIREYRDTHGDCRVPRTYKDPRDGYPLGKLVSDIRNIARTNTKDKHVPDKYREALNELGFDWGKPMAAITEERWLAGLALLKDYLNHGNSAATINQSTMWNGQHLGKWVYRQICSYNHLPKYPPISDEKAKQLIALGVDMSPKRRKTITAD